MVVETTVVTTAEVETTVVTTAVVETTVAVTTWISLTESEDTDPHTVNTPALM